MRIVRYYPRALAGDGGMTGAVRAWSHALAGAGARAVVAFEEGVPPPANGNVQWVPVRHKRTNAVKIPVGLEEVLRGADLLVLHSGWTLHNVWAASVARRLRVPYLLEPRGAYDPHILRRKKLLKRLWWSALESELVSQARAIHVFFEVERGHLEALGYRGPLVVAPNGIESTEGLAWDGGTGGYLLWLGRFDPEHKGLDLLLRALRLLSDQERPSVRIHGPDWHGQKARVKRMVSRLDLGRWVTVGEPVYGPDKSSVLAGARGFVYPSRWDACPNSVLEAVSAGVPTLATSFPLGRYLASRGAALLAEPDPGDLAGWLGHLCTPEASDVGRRGSQVVAEELTWDRVARQWLAQVETIL